MRCRAMSAAAALIHAVYGRTCPGVEACTFDRLIVCHLACRVLPPSRGDGAQQIVLTQMSAAAGEH